MQFAMFRGMRKIRDFRLELCAEVCGGAEEYTMQVLRWAVAVEGEQRGFDDIFPEPLVFCSPRISHCGCELESATAGSSTPWMSL